MDSSTHPPLKVAPLQRLGVYAAVILAAVLVGFLPTWLTSRTRANERDAALTSLRLATMETTLASAALHAGRGDYELARAAASAFYTELRAEFDRPLPVFTASQRERLQPILAERDQTITLLARSDPAVAARLSDAYLSYRRAIATPLPEASQKLPSTGKPAPTAGPASAVRGTSGRARAWAAAASRVESGTEAAYRPSTIDDVYSCRIRSRRLLSS